MRLLESEFGDKTKLHAQTQKEQNEKRGRAFKGLYNLQNTHLPMLIHTN